MKLVNILDSKSSGVTLEGSSPSPGTTETLAFVIGAALGDGNLSNPNGRAVRLRITCDLKYGYVIEDIRTAITTLMPHNKVAVVMRTDRCVDISCYSNDWEKLLGWRASLGPKHVQQVHVPAWILNNHTATMACLRGLFITDGSIYRDRGYLMINFTSIIQPLAKDVSHMIDSLGFCAHTYTTNPTRPNEQVKYVVRISKHTSTFLNLIHCQKVISPYITSDK